MNLNHLQPIRFALAATLMLAGCSSGPAPEPGNATPAAAPPVELKASQRDKEPTAKELGGARDTLVVAFQADAATLLSVVAQSAADSYIMNNLFMPPLDSDFDCGLKYVQGLTESWEFSEDSLILKTRLRSDISWYDKTPVTARDYKFTYDLVRDPLVASPRIAYVEHMVAGKDPLIIDDYNLEWHFTRAYDRTTMLAHVSSLPLLPEHLLRDADRSTLRGHPMAKAPVSTGSFRISEWKPNEKIVLVPNENFSGPEQWQPRLKRVIFKILPEYATRLVELENGSADMMEQILVADADRLAVDHPEIRLYRRGWRSQDYLAWNQFDSADYKAKQTKAGKKLDWKDVKRHHIFGDRAVRRAISKAVDVERIIADLMTSKVGTKEVYGKRAVGTITPALCDVHNSEIQPIPYDLTAAKAELEAAGWVDVDGDGIRERDGKKLAFTLMINSGNSRRAKGAVIVQANLKEIGAHVEIETVESNTFFERLRKKDFECALSGWAAGLFVDMSTIWHSGEKYEFNFTGYENPEVDTLIEQGLNEPDPARSAVIWKRVQALIYEDQPYTFLYWMDEIVGLHRRVKDAKVNIESNFHRMDTWWVPDGEIKYPN